MVGSMYQAETPVGLCKYKDNEKGEQAGLMTSARGHETVHRVMDKRFISRSL